MIRSLQVLQVVIVGLWTGGLLALGAVAAPAVFSAAPSRPLAGRIFGAVLLRFDKVELAFAAAALCTMVLLAVFTAGRRRWIGLVLATMLTSLACVTALGVHPAVVAERTKIVNFDSLSEGDPSKARFDALHRLSVRLSGAKLLLGLLLLGGTAWGFPRQDTHAV